MKTTADKNSQYSLIKQSLNFQSHAEAAVITLNHIFLVALTYNLEVGPSVRWRLYQITFGGPFLPDFFYR